MSKFTKTEIGLCRKIAEFWKKEIAEGDYFIFPDISDKPIFCAYSNKGWHKRNEETIVPLLSIQDALGWLREKNYYLGHIDFYENRIVVHFNLPISSGKDKPIDGDGKTLLEALLNVILEVLRKSK